MTVRRSEADRLDKLVASVGDAERLRALIDDPVVQRFFETEERRHLETALAALDDPARLIALADARAVRGLRTHLRAVMATGARSAEKLTQRQETIRG